MNRLKYNNQKSLLMLLLLYYVVFMICALLLQIKSGELPSVSGTVFDRFTGSLLWMISIISLVIASQYIGKTKNLLLWLLVSAASAGLAIDEMFEFHEATRFIVGDDDYIKILFMFCAGAGAFVLYKVEKPSLIVIKVFLMGLIFQALYLITDMGDGDFFTLPFDRIPLLWAEEILETLSMQGYLAGILLHYQMSRSNKILE